MNEKELFIKNLVKNIQDFEEKTGVNIYNIRFIRADATNNTKLSAKSIITGIGMEMD